MGIAGEKARHGEGAYRDGRGGGGPAVGSVFGAGGAAHRRPRATGGCCLAGGGWRLRGVEVEDEPQALDSYPTAAKSTDQR